MEVPGEGVESEHQLPPYDAAVTLLDPYAKVRPGTKPETSWLLVRFVPTAPQWELPAVRFLTHCATR